MVPTINNQLSKQSQAVPIKAGRRWFHQNPRNINRDITNSHRQPSSRLRSSSPTALKQPSATQPLRKLWGSSHRCRRGLPHARTEKWRLRGTLKSPLRHHTVPSKLPTPTCMDSRGFQIYIDPPSPLEASISSDHSQRSRVKTDIGRDHVTNLQFQFKPGLSLSSSPIEATQMQTRSPTLVVVPSEQRGVKHQHLAKETVSLLPTTPRGLSVEGYVCREQKTVGETGFNLEHNKLPRKDTAQLFNAWVLEGAGFKEHTKQNAKATLPQCCWDGRALKQFLLSLVIDHWIGEVIKWTEGVGQATPGVRCPQHRVGLCPVTLKRFRRQPFSQRQGK